MSLTQKGLLLAGIVDALTCLKEVKGSTGKAIVKYILSNPLPDMCKRCTTEIAIQKAIKSAVEDKILRQNHGRFLIDFERVASLANAAEICGVGGHKSVSFFNTASVMDALARNSCPVDRMGVRKTGCKPKKRRRSRRSCKKRRHRSRSCKKRRHRSRSCKKRRRRSRSCKKKHSKRRGRSCKKKRSKRRGRSCKKKRSKRRGRSCKKSRRRRRSRSSSKKLRRRSCRKRRRTSCGRRHGRAPDETKPPWPMPDRRCVYVMKDDSQANLISKPSLPTTASIKYDNSLTRSSASDNLVDKMGYKYLRN